MSPTDSEADAPPSAAETWLRPLLLLLGVVLALIGARALGVPSHLGVLRVWILSLGSLGPVVYALIYVLGVLIAIPSGALSALSGLLFGSVIGVIVASIGSTVGASLAFLIARYVARDSIQRWVSRYPKFQQLDEKIERHGASVVMFTRLVPIFPVPVLNYAFGLTRLPFWTYVVWSWLCMLPGILVYTLGADALARALTQQHMPWHLVAVVAALVVALVIATPRLYAHLRKS